MRQCPCRLCGCRKCGDEAPPRGSGHQQCCGIHMQGILSGAGVSSLSPQGHITGTQKASPVGRGAFLQAWAAYLQVWRLLHLRTQAGNPHPLLVGSGLPPSRGEQANPFSSFLPRRPIISPICILILSQFSAHVFPSQNKNAFPVPTSLFILCLVSLPLMCEKLTQEHPHPRQLSLMPYLPLPHSYRVVKASGCSL